MKNYTVIGVYTEPFGQRFAFVVEAASPQQAEYQIADEVDGPYLVAGVVEGAVKVVDTYTDGVAA